MTHFCKGIAFVVFWLIWIVMIPFLVVAAIAQPILIDCYPGKKEWEGWVKLE